MKLYLFLIAAAILTFMACETKPKVQKSADYYTEQHRPQFHFSPEKAWMNDPNGLIFYKGEYHLFYQHNPDSSTWGTMHWAHAVSTDLVHWAHLPIALFPDSIGWIFSGSAVIDHENTSGFGQNREGAEKPMVAIFTYHNMEWERAGRKDRESQGIAYSLDKGRTWTKYAGNPVIKNKGDVDFRDPKVFWHAPTRRWIMPLAVGEQLEIFTSPDLKNWEFASTFGKGEGAHGGVWECPDLFPLKNTEGVEKWILNQNMGRGAVNGGSGTQYFVGQFDGKVFKNDNPPNTKLWVDYGADNYAGVTWADAPDNRRIFIGWLSNWDDYANKVPTEKWRSALTVPRDLTLGKTTEGVFFLNQMPVPEIEKLRKNKVALDNQKFSKQLKINSLAKTKDIELTFDMSQTTAQNIGFKLMNTKGEFVEIGFDKTKSEVYIDRIHSGKTSFSTKFAKRHVAPFKVGKTLTIRALADVSSIEVFIDGGKIALTDVFFPNEDFTELQLFADGEAVVSKAVVYELASIWR